MHNSKNIEQLVGPFEINQELLNFNISRLGITSDTETKFTINGEEILIGESEIYEVSDVNINSLKFLTKTNEKTLVELMVE